MGLYRQKVQEAAAFISERINIQPDIGILTGTGLQNAASTLHPECSIPYEDIPNFPVSTVESHPGILVSGTLSEKQVIVLKGRLHLYEGFASEDVVFPVRVLQELGVHTLIVSNAAGGLNPGLTPGDIMVISDHINLTGENPLTGSNENEWGIRFPDMANAYDKDLALKGLEAGESLQLPVKKGVYVGLRGPSLETPAETRFLQLIKADAVGFSTVCEVIAAVHANMRVLGFSLISNINDPDNPVPVTLEDVVEVAGEAAGSLDRIIQHVLEHLN